MNKTRRRNIVVLLVLIVALVAIFTVFLLVSQGVVRKLSGYGRPFIYNGEIVPKGQLLGIVGLTYEGSRRPRCTGTLIAPDMVLTAAHCVCSIQPSHIFVGENPLDKQPATAGRYYRAGAWRAALRCGEQASSDGVDIAVVAIDGHVGIATPFQFASEQDVESSQAFQVAGYGATDLTGKYFDYKKRKANLPAISVGCKTELEAAKYGCEPTEIVAGRWGTPDTCRGDSGGPLMVLGNFGLGNPRIAGVTSRKAIGPNVCGNGGIYERTSHYENWIKAAVASLREEA